MLQNVFFRLPTYFHIPGADHCEEKKLCEIIIYSDLVLIYLVAITDKLYLFLIQMDTTVGIA